jgi:hypothetical protein
VLSLSNAAQITKLTNGRLLLSCCPFKVPPFLFLAIHAAWSSLPMGSLFSRPRRTCGSGPLLCMACPSSHRCGYEYCSTNSRRVWCEDKSTFMHDHRCIFVEVDVTPVAKPSATKSKHTHRSEIAATRMQNFHTAPVALRRSTHTHISWK